MVNLKASIYQIKVKSQFGLLSDLPVLIEHNWEQAENPQISLDWELRAKRTSTGPFIITAAKIWIFLSFFRSKNIRKTMTNGVRPVNWQLISIQDLDLSKD